MSDEVALLRAIRAARDDDTPRLVYADWLDDHGDPARAEFIRVQCWLSANPADHPDWDLVWNREQQLLTTHADEWMKPFDGMLARGHPRAPFDRGFPAWLPFEDALRFTCFADEIERHAATDRFALHWGGSAEFWDMLRHPVMRGVRGLWLYWQTNGPDYEEFEHLSRSDSAQQLRLLDISGCQYLHHHDDIRILSTTPCFPDLEYIGISLNSGGDWEAVARLLTSPYRQRLTGLSVPYFHDEDVVALCEYPAAARLRHLYLENFALTEQAAERLAAGSFLDNLQSIAFGVSNLDLPPRFTGLIDERFGDRVKWLEGDSMTYHPGVEAYRRYVTTGRAR